MFGKLQQQFFCCYPVNRMAWSKLQLPLELDAQRALIAATCAHPLNQRFPVRRSYQEAFVKRLMQVLKDHEELHDDIYTSLCGQLVKAHTNETAFIPDSGACSLSLSSYAHKHYMLQPDVQIVMRESTCFVNKGTTGLCTWEAALALADYLLVHSKLLHGKNVLELGAGAGLLGILLKQQSLKLSVKQVLITDGSAACVQLMHANIALNFAEPSDAEPPKCAQLRWNEISEFPWSQYPEPDLLLAADVIYDDTQFSVLFQALDFIYDRLSNRCDMLLASTLRNVDTLHSFMHQLDLGNKEAKCKYCRNVLSSKSQSNLWRHLSSKHPTAKEPVVRQSDETADVGEEINRQQRVTEFFHKPITASKSKKIDRQVVKMIAKGHHALRMVEEPEFRQLIEDVSHCPGYKLPTRKTVSNVLMSQICQEQMAIIKEEMVDATAVCLTTDCWTSLALESFMAVTAHFIEKQSTTLKSFMLSCEQVWESRTSQNLAERLKKVVVEWNIQNKVAAIASDNAYNIVGAIKMGSWRHIPYFAHNLNLIVQKGLEQIYGIRKKFSAVVQSFHRSTTAYKKLKDTQLQLNLPDIKLVQDVPTRWNSTFKLFERLITLKEAVMLVVAILRPDLGLTNQDFEVIEGVQPILQPFLQVTTEISAEKNVTLSKVIVLAGILQKKIACISFGLNESAAAVGTVLMKEMEHRFKDLESNPLFAESTILDPRFKGRVFRNQDTFKTSVSNIKKNIQRHANDTPENTVEEEIVPKTTDDDIWKEYDDIFQKVSKPSNNTAASIREMEKYLSEEYLNRKDDPLKWWEQRKGLYPHLYQYMVKRMCLLGTSVPCERIFSSAAQTITKRRTLLKPKQVNNLTFLHNNM